MKKVFLILLGLLYSEVVFAQKGEQIVGLNIGSSIAADGLGKQIYEPALQTTVGGFYNWNFGQRFGLSLGTNLSVGKERNYYDCFMGSAIPAPNSTVYKLQLPFSLTLNLNANPTSPFRTYFVVGYTFNSELNSRQIPSQYRIFDSIIDNYSFNYNEANYLTAGLEFRRILPNKFVAALCPNSQLLTNGYGPEGRIGLQLKLGKTL